MNLQQMLEEALAHVDSMTAEDFESECIKAGYKPARKHTFKMSEKSAVSATGTMTYRHSVSLSGYDKDAFALQSVNDYTFQIAA